MTGMDRLEALREEWSALWDRCEYATPFQSPEWLIPWWRTFHPGELCPVEIRTGGRLSGFVPMYRDAAGVTRLVGAGNSDYLDALLDAGVDAAAAYEAAGRFEFQDLRPGSPLLPAAPGRAHIERTEPCPVLALPATLEAWRAALRQGLKRNMRRYREKLGEAAFETHTSPEYLEELFRLHTARWGALRGESGVLADGCVREFHREVARGFARRGWLRFWTVRVRGSIGAVIYAFVCRARVYFYLSGFEPGLARFSPGTLAVGYAIESAIGEGARELDFLRGGEPYKYVWGAEDRWNLRVSAPAQVED